MAARPAMKTAPKPASRLIAEFASIGPDGVAVGPTGCAPVPTGVVAAGGAGEPAGTVATGAVGSGAGTVVTCETGITVVPAVGTTWVSVPMVMVVGARQY